MVARCRVAQNLHLCPSLVGAFRFAKTEKKIRFAKTQSLKKKFCKIKKVRKNAVLGNFWQLQSNFLSLRFHGATVSQSSSMSFIFIIVL